MKIIMRCVICKAPITSVQEFKEHYNYYENQPINYVIDMIAFLLINPIRIMFDGPPSSLYKKVKGNAKGA